MRIVAAHLDETIAAVASAPGLGARAIIRVSGSRAPAVVHSLLGQQPVDSVSTNYVIHGQLRLRLLAAQFPATVYVWPTERSYTRQPLAEIHTLASPPLLEAVLKVLCQSGARLADPGEFTMRAFLAGRLDLTQAEAVLGVIDAETDTGLHVALQQLAGGISQHFSQLRHDLLTLLADLEAGLDFVDEDISFVQPAESTARLQDAVDLANRLSRQLDARSTTGVLPRVVICGPPNAGKSSLLNALIGRASAVVHDQPGTTRDYVSCVCQLGEIKCELIDTAGIAPPEMQSPIDRSAQQVAKSEARRADVRLVCYDSSLPDVIDPADGCCPADQKTIYVLTKCDLDRRVQMASSHVACSSATGVGVERLAEVIGQRLQQTLPVDVVSATAVRCQETLQEVTRALQRSFALAQQRSGDELLAAELRVALEGLGRVVGAVYTDDILDRIFQPVLHWEVGGRS